MDNDKIKTFYEIANDHSEPPQPIIDDGILLDSSLLTIIGKHKSNKSFLAFNLSVAIASGMEFGGFKVIDKHRVLILSAEGGYYPNRARIQRMVNNMAKENLQNILYSNKVIPDLGNEAEDDMFNFCLGKYKPKVLILDPFIRFHTSDENSSSKMSIIFAKIRDIIESYGIAVILVHHTGKDAYKGGRGSSVIHGEYDSCITIEKKKDRHLFKFDMRHVETPDPKELVFNTETFWFEDPYKSSPVVEYIKQNGLSRKKDIVSYLITTLPCSSAKAYRIMDSAVSEGLILVTGKKYKLSS